MCKEKETFDKEEEIKNTTRTNRARFYDTRRQNDEKMDDGSSGNSGSFVCDSFDGLGQTRLLPRKQRWLFLDLQRL
jgi:hypothetical protein